MVEVKLLQPASPPHTRLLMLWQAISLLSGLLKAGPTWQ